MAPDQNYRATAGRFMLIKVEDVDKLTERVADRRVEVMQTPQDWSQKFMEF